MRFPSVRTMAFMADIHGNLDALDAVLQALEEHQVNDIYVAGDLLFGGDQPLGVWHRLQDVHARCVRGLSDTALCQLKPSFIKPANPHEESMATRFIDIHHALGELIVERLRRLPETMRIPMVNGGEILMVHGSPEDPLTEINHAMSDDEIAERLDNDPAEIVVCGSSHVPFDRVVNDVRVINVGSVGEAPEGQNAHYTLITPRNDGVDVSQQWVEWSAAS